MKILMRLGIALFILIGLIIIALGAYGLGENVEAIIPSWLTSFIVGIAIVTTAIIIVSIFALGIVKIKEGLNGKV